MLKISASKLKGFNPADAAEIAGHRQAEIKEAEGKEDPAYEHQLGP